MYYSITGESLLEIIANGFVVNWETKQNEIKAKPTNYSNSHLHQMKVQRKGYVTLYFGGDLSKLWTLK